MVNDKQLHEKLRGESWEQYGTEIVKDYPQLLEKIVPRYAKIKATVGLGELPSKEEKDVESDWKMICMNFNQWFIFIDNKNILWIETNVNNTKTVII